MTKTSIDMAKDTTGRLHVTVKTAGKRKLSSKLWLERQLNDPYVAKARRDGYRSRAAYKLIELDERARFTAGPLEENERETQEAGNRHNIENSVHR